MSVAVRNSQELDLMRKSGHITALALKKTLASVREGISLKELDKIAEKEIEKLGGKSSFKTVQGYFWTTCLTVNDEVVHGIPRDIKLKKGDVLGVDLGAVYHGWHTDTAWSVVVGEKTSHFLEVGEQALWAALDQAVEGNYLGDISAAIQSKVEGAGFTIVKNYTGHGVGKSPHEEPTILGYGKKGTGMVLKAGMTLAIEVIYTSGGSEVYEKEDGWTVATEDGSLGGLFEMTVIVGKAGPEIITDFRKV